MHVHRWACALPLGAVAAALALSAPAEGAPDPAAGWHGREIRAPFPVPPRPVSGGFPDGWSAGPVALGTGTRRPGGSRRVREIQRRLLRRGYRTGPADGRFGPRTKAAVTWFQIKHRLPRTGRVDAATLARLRTRTSGAPMTPASAPALPEVAPTVVAATPSTAALDPLPAILLSVVILAGLVALGAWIWPALRPRRKPALAEAPELAARHLAIVPPVEPDREVLGYVAVASGDPEGALEASALVIAGWCEDRGWPLAKVVHDVATGGRRPGLSYALDEIGAGRAAGLVVVRLRDLTGSLTELGPLLEWFVKAEAFVISLDYELDSSSPAGEFAARALVTVSEWERARVAERTRTGLAATRRGAASAAAVSDDPDLRTRITTMRAGGMSLQAIADTLNEEGVPTLRGGSHWRPSSVQSATGYKRPSPKARGVDLPRLDRERDA